VDEQYYGLRYTAIFPSDVIVDAAAVETRYFLWLKSYLVLPDSLGDE